MDKRWEDGEKVEAMLGDILNTIMDQIEMLKTTRKEVHYFEWNKLDTAIDALIKAGKTVKRAHAGYVGGEAYPGEFARIEEHLWWQ